MNCHHTSSNSKKCLQKKGDPVPSGVIGHGRKIHPFEPYVYHKDLPKHQKHSKICDNQSSLQKNISSKIPRQKTPPNQPIFPASMTQLLWSPCLCEEFPTWQFPALPPSRHHWDMPSRRTPHRPCQRPRDHQRRLVMEKRGQKMSFFRCLHVFTELFTGIFHGSWWFKRKACAWNLLRPLFGF